MPAGTPYGLGRSPQRSPAMGAPGGAFQAQMPQFGRSQPQKKPALPTPPGAGAAPRISDFIGRAQQPAMAFYQKALGMAPQAPQAAPAPAPQSQGQMPASPAFPQAAPGAGQPQQAVQQGQQFGAYQQALGMKPAAVQPAAPTLPPPPPMETQTQALTGEPNEEGEFIGHVYGKGRTGLHWPAGHVFGDNKAYDSEGNEYEQNGQGYFAPTGGQEGSATGAPSEPTDAPVEETAPAEPEGPQGEVFKLGGEGEVNQDGVEVYQDANGKHWALINGEYYEVGSAEYQAAVQGSAKTGKAEDIVFDTIASLDEPVDTTQIMSKEDEQAVYDDMAWQSKLKEEEIASESAAKQAAMGLTGAGGTAQASSAYAHTQLEAALQQQKNQFHLGLISDALQKKINAATAALNGALGILGLDQQAELQAKINTMQEEQNAVDEKNTGAQFLSAWFNQMANQEDELSGDEQTKMMDAYAASDPPNLEAAMEIAGQWGEGEL